MKNSSTFQNILIIALLALCGYLVYRLNIAPESSPLVPPAIAPGKGGLCKDLTDLLKKDQPLVAEEIWALLKKHECVLGCVPGPCNTNAGGSTGPKTLCCNGGNRPNLIPAPALPPLSPVPTWACCNIIEILDAEGNAKVCPGVLTSEKCVDGYDPEALRECGENFRLVRKCIYPGAVSYDTFPVPK